MWTAKSLQQQHNMTTVPRKILVHMGFLSQKSGFKMAETSTKGGPLGELVQWSDIICTLFILGQSVKCCVCWVGINWVFLLQGVDQSEQS